MDRAVLVIDIEKCENCNNCFMACKDEHVGNHWEGYTLPQPRREHRWMNIHTREQGGFPHIRVVHRPSPCYHCHDAPCIRKAPEGAIRKREDGIVLIDEAKAKGQKDLVKACPFGAIWWNRELEVPQKCTLCAHLLDSGWEKPRCVQACPTGALTFHRVPEKDMSRFIRNHHLEAPRGTDPEGHHGVWYKNSDLYFKGFIAGAVATRENDLETCLAGAQVILEKESEPLQEVLTDGFGDYRFTGIDFDSGTYHIRIRVDNQLVGELDVAMGKGGFTQTLWV